MKKKVLMSALWGFPVGIAIGHVITILLSFARGDGGFYPCMPELISAMGGELQAVTLQTLLYGCIGMSFSASSRVWQMDGWSLLRQTGVYFLINAAVLLLAAYILRWMHRSVVGFLIYLGIFTLIFALAWVIQYGIWKHSLKKINQKLNKLNQS